MTQPPANGDTSASSGRTPTQGNHFDPWYDVYADRAYNLRASEIRALLPIVPRPRAVFLVGGMPNLRDLSLDKLTTSAKKLIRNHGTQAMQCGSGQGWEVLHECITEVMGYDGTVGADPGGVAIMTGSQQALDLVTELFVNPGDVILVEVPSYAGALGVLRAHQADVAYAVMDKHDIIPEALVETTRDVRASGHTIKFIYTILNYRNPTGVALPAGHRPIAAEIYPRKHALIVEDNLYGLPGFHNDPLPTIVSYSPEDVVYLGSFSKMFAPGFRIGWAYVPHIIRVRLIPALKSIILCPPMVDQVAIADYLGSYGWYGQVKSFRSIYAERCRAMLTSLEEYMPSYAWTVSDGGFYTWVTLPKGLDAKAILPRVIRAQVAYVLDMAFFYDSSGSSYLRLSSCCLTFEDVHEGIRRLSTAVNTEKEIVGVFDTASGDEAEAGSDR